MTQRYTLKGINSDTETCDNCGKTGLKRVMWLDSLDEEGNETGVVRAMGSTCGAKALGLKGEFKTVEQVAEVVNKAAKVEASKAAAIKRAKEMVIEFNDEIGIVRHQDSYTAIRGKAYDANPRGINVVQWIK